MYEERFTRVIGHGSILFVQGTKHNGAVYPPDHPLPRLEERQLMWNGAGLPPTDTPFQIELPAGFDFGKYVWGRHGAEWAAIQRAGRFQYELRFSWAYKHPIPDGTPFVGDVRHAGIAKVPRVLVLGYVIDPDSDFVIWDNNMWHFWRMVCCWWASFCLGNDVSLWEYLSG
ncbi:hypothetical protein FALCPG4_011558 [Fusarium falciforme]